MNGIFVCFFSCVIFFSVHHSSSNSRCTGKTIDASIVCWVLWHMNGLTSETFLLPIWLLLLRNQFSNIKIRNNCSKPSTTSICVFSAKIHRTLDFIFSFTLCMCKRLHFPDWYCFASLLLKVLSFIALGAVFISNFKIISG